MKTDHINCPIRPRVTLDNPDEPLEMIGFTIARYKFACKWMRETDRVLEVGCGEGFGCNFFSRHVAEVTGLDIDPQTVERCRRAYQRDNLRYVVGDIVHPTDKPRGDYDVVVSFEMIEHVSHDDGQRMAANVAAHLKDRGMAILSTPRARPDRSVSRQHMHVFEYDYPTLLATLQPHFHRVTVFCQNDEYIYAGHPSTAWNYIALCFK
jgi:2-polyprenyl-3-methyl-5-hydroxy-6-metoxy-1,4-benzoquinol methylase